jgi:hypothetical protein
MIDFVVKVNILTTINKLGFIFHSIINPKKLIFSHHNIGFKCLKIKFY